MFLCSFDKTDSDDNWYAVEWYASKNDFTTYRFDENSDYNMYLVSFYAIKNQNGEQIYDYFYGFDEGGNEGEDEGAVIRDQEFSDFDYKGLPTTGKPKALVVPVQFSDDKFTTKELADLKLAFNGTSEQTGYESVNSYYKASSYGNLDIQFDVFDVFTYEGSVEDFETEYFYYELMPDEYYSPLETILTKLFETYDDTVDFSTYDNDKDGYIDSIYYVYSAGYSDDTDDNFWWAWTDMYAYETDVADNVEGCYYVWASVDFIYDSIVEADAENGVSEVKVNVNAVTYIHETGHLLMLDDYYDYDTTQGPVGGIGGGDMMDCNIADHNSFSKIILGWTKPIEVTTTQTVTISSINDSSKTTNNCIILRKDNTTATAQNAYNAEYLLIDLYAPIGLNRLTNGIMGYPNQTAVRIYHVDANLGIYYTDEYNNTYFGYMCDNGTTKDKLIKLLEADGDNSIEKVTTENQGCGDLAKMSDYYIAGSKMPTTYKWNDGSAIKYQIEVTSIDSVNNTATISVIVG